MANTWQLLATIFVDLLIGFMKFSSVDSFPSQVANLDQYIQLNSTEYYDNQTASWIFVFNLDILPAINNLTVGHGNSSKVSIPRILRVVLELNEDESIDVEGSSLFASGSTERLQYIKLFTPNNSQIYQENVTYVYFDHAYSGNYKLKVDGCENRHSCIKRIYEADLGTVTTNLRNLDVSKMNMSISTTPLDMGGVDVAFTVHYHNKTDAFLPFESFEVTLIPSDARQKSYSIETIEPRVEFRQWANCHSLTQNLTTTTTHNFTLESEFPSTGYFNLTDGQYTIRIDPIDSRCNYPEQVVASIKRPCRRYVISNLTVSPERFRRDKDIITQAINNSSAANFPAEIIQAAIDRSILQTNSASTSDCPTVCWLWKFVLAPLMHF